MSDEKLRELERRWKETGAVEDEAAYLLERVRAGELTQERLELAARMGNRGAMFAANLPRLADLNEALDMFAGVSPQLIAAAAAAVYEPVAEHASKRQASPGSSQWQTSLSGARHWEIVKQLRLWADSGAGGAPDELIRLGSAAGEEGKTAQGALVAQSAAFSPLRPGGLSLLARQVRQVLGPNGFNECSLRQRLIAVLFRQVRD